MAALAMSGAPPPLPSRDGRPPSNTLPRRASAHQPQRAQSQISSPRNRRLSENELPPPPPRSRNDPLPPVPPSVQSLPRQDDLPPPPPRGKQDPLPPPPPSIGTLPPPRGNHARQSSQYTSQTLPRNARSETNLQSAADTGAPRLPPRRNASIHGGHGSSGHNHMTNGSLPQRILENVAMSSSGDLESRFPFHDVNELPPPPEFKDVKKKYSSQEYERHRKRGTPDPNY